MWVPTFSPLRKLRFREHHDLPKPINSGPGLWQWQASQEYCTVYQKKWFRGLRFSHCVFIKTIFFEHLLYVVVVQSLSDIQLFATPWTVARQASLSLTTSWRLLRFMSSESVMPSNHPILCRPLLLLSSVLPSTRVFSNESAVCIRWPKTGASASSLVLQWIFRVDIL